QSERFGADPNSWRLWAARIRRADAGVFGRTLAEAASDRLRYGIDRHRSPLSWQRRARDPAGCHAAGPGQGAARRPEAENSPHHRLRRAKPHLEQTLAIIREVAREEGLSFRMGVLRADIERTVLKAALRSNGVVPIDGMAMLDA